MSNQGSGKPPPGGWPQQGYPPQPQAPQQPPQPGYAPQPPQPGYAPQPPQPGYAPQPLQPGYAPHPPQPGYAPPPQPGYAPQPAQPGYAPQPPQSGYAPQPAQPGYPPQPGYSPSQLPPAIANQPGQRVGAPPAWAPTAPPPGSPQVPAETGMFKRSLGRALRLRIEPHEVSPKEREALLAANPPITTPSLQAFLAWRRSVLFLVALALIPLTALRVYDAFDEGLPSELRFIVLIPAAAEAFLCLVCLYQLKHWTHWRQQRRALMKAWVVFMAAPFLVFLVPIDAILEGMVANQVAGTAGDAWGAEAGAGAVDMAAAAPVIAALKATIAIYALLTLAPKAVSLLAGTIRAGIVTKMLFPGTSGPGWIVVLATPLYALFVFTLLIVPYQLTGSGWYLGAMIALAAAQLSVGRAGYALAKPTTHADAVTLVSKARAAYLVSMLAFGVCLLVALGALATQLGVSTIISTALSFETNVLLLTLIGSDLVITSLARGRGLASAGTAHLVEESNQQLTAFVGESSAT